ncbi:hypothetical protein GCM10010330_51480 [Streptomyces tendae]|nr:hypothetical protein GCM10010330_51480 [Streptomyces tendae]
MCMTRQTLSSTSWMDDAPWPVSWLTGTTARAPPSRTASDPVAARWSLSSHSRLLGDAMHALSPHRAPTTYNQYAGRRPARRGHAPDAAEPALRADDGNVTTGPRAGAGLPDSQWRGPHRHHTGFPFTKAWRQ